MPVLSIDSVSITSIAHYHHNVIFNPDGPLTFEEDDIDGIAAGFGSLIDFWPVSQPSFDRDLVVSLLLLALWLACVKPKAIRIQLDKVCLLFIGTLNVN